MKVFPTYRHDDGREYSLPFYIPPKRKGHFSVSIEFKPAGAKLPVVSMRNSIFMGLPTCEVLLEKPLGIHYLKEEGHGTWMTSMPQEIEQISRQVMNMSGRVLVGGLGLGLAACYLEGNDKVTEIVVVEKSYAILELVSIHMPKRKTCFVREDLYTYLKNCTRKFDHAFYDIWCPTGESILTQHVLPLRRLSRGLLPQKNIECWNEDEMIGQVRSSCETSLLFLDAPEGSPFRAVLECDKERFEKMKNAHGMVWYWYRWLREDEPTKQQAAAKVKQFIADLKDPDKFEEEWG